MRLTTFASGSSGNCALLCMDSACILLDAGISYRRIRENLALLGLRPEQLTAVLISHEHSDHISGLATMVRKSCIPVCAPRTVANHLRRTVAGVDQCLREIPVGETVELGGLRLRAFHTPHDTPESVGWRIEGSEIFALATDLGCITDEVRQGLTGADAVLIEANHDEELLRGGAYPFYLKKRILSDHGHLSNENCGVLARSLADSGTRYIVLGHLSRENNRPALAFSTVKAALAGTDAALYVAPAEEPLTLEVKGARPCFM